MLAFLAFIAVAFAADMVTEVSTYTGTDNDQIFSFYLFELDKCYLYSTSPTYTKVTKDGDSYTRTIHSEDDCSDDGTASTLSSDYVEGETGFIYGTFGDDSECSYATDENNEVAYMYITNACISSSGSSYKYTLDGTSINTKSYVSSDCSGTGYDGSVDLSCDVCDAGTYYKCGEESGANGASLTSIIFVALAVIMMMI